MSSSDTPFTCWAKHSFQKSSEDELNFTVGDEIEVIETDKDYDDGWYYGRNSKTGQQGIFPFTYVTISREDSQTTQLADWSSDQVSKWIGSLNLPEASKIQEKCQWNGEQLMDLHMVKLEELGLFSIRTRIKLLQAIVALRTGVDGSVRVKSSESHGMKGKSIKRDSNHSNIDTRSDSTEIFFRQQDAPVDPGNQDQLLTPNSLPARLVDSRKNEFDTRKTETEADLAIAKEMKDVTQIQTTFSHPTDVVLETLTGKDTSAPLNSNDRDEIENFQEKAVQFTQIALSNEEQKTHYRNRSCATNTSVFTVSDYIVTPLPPVPADDFYTPKLQRSLTSESEDIKQNFDDSSSQPEPVITHNNHELSAIETFTLTMEELKLSSPPPIHQSPGRTRKLSSNTSIKETFKKIGLIRKSSSPKTSLDRSATPSSMREIFLNRFGARPTGSNGVDTSDLGDERSDSVVVEHVVEGELVESSTNLIHGDVPLRSKISFSERMSRAFAKLHVPWRKDKSRRESKDVQSLASSSGTLPSFTSDHEVKRSMSLPNMSAPPQRQSLMETFRKRVSTFSFREDENSPLVSLDEAMQSGWLNVKKEGKLEWQKRYGALIGSTLYLLKSDTNLKPVAEIAIDFKNGIGPSSESRAFAFQYCNEDKSAFYHFAPGNQLEMVKWIDSMVRCQESRKKGKLIPIKSSRPLPATISEQLRNPSPNDMMVTTLVEKRPERISYGNPKFMPERPSRVDIELVILHCGHLFHHKCITELLKYNNKKCPNCRQKIEFNKLPFQLFEGSSPVEAKEIQVQSSIPPAPRSLQPQELLMRDLMNKSTQIEEMALRIEELQYQIDDHEDGVTPEEFEHLEARCATLLSENEVLRASQTELVKSIRVLEDKEIRKNAAINALKAQITQTNSEMQIERSNIQTLQATVKMLEKKIEAYKAASHTSIDNSRLRPEWKEKLEKINDICTDRELLVEILNYLFNEFKNTTDGYEKFKERATRLKDERNSLLTEKDTLIQKIQALETEIKAIKLLNAKSVQAKDYFAGSAPVVVPKVFPGSNMSRKKSKVMAPVESNRQSNGMGGFVKPTFKQFQPR